MSVVVVAGFGVAGFVVMVRLPATRLRTGPTVFAALEGRWSERMSWASHTHRGRHRGGGRTTAGRRGSSALTSTSQTMSGRVAAV